MFYPAGLGIDLCEFLLCHRADVTLLVKQDAAGVVDAVDADGCFAKQAVCISRNVYEFHGKSPPFIMNNTKSDG